MAADITTVGGTPLSSSQGNAESVVNPNENYLAQYATALGVSLALTLTTSLTLTLPQMGPSLWIFGGTPVGAITATLQVISFGQKTIKNSCGQPITFTYSSGTTVTIPSGGSWDIWGDGTNIYLKGVQGVWTPVLTFATPGNLSAAYTVQNGKYELIGRTVHARFDIELSTFTFTTASGNAQITGLPFTSASGNASTGVIAHSNVTFTAGNTQLALLLPASSSVLNLYQSGSGIAYSALTQANFTTAVLPSLIGNITYNI